MQGIEKTILWLTRLLAALGAACLASITLLIVLAVVMRYGLGAPFGFTEELAGLLMLSAVFLGLPYVLMMQAHIRVGLLYERTTGKLKRVLWVLSQLILILFAVVFFRDALADVRLTMMLNLRSEVARIDLFTFVLLMPLSMALIVFIATWQLLQIPPDFSPSDNASPVVLDKDRAE